MKLWLSLFCILLVGCSTSTISEEYRATTCDELVPAKILHDIFSDGRTWSNGDVVPEQKIFVNNTQTYEGSYRLVCTIGMQSVSGRIEVSSTPTIILNIQELASSTLNPSEITRSILLVQTTDKNYANDSLQSDAIVDYAVTERSDSLKITALASSEKYLISLDAHHLGDSDIPMMRSNLLELVDYVGVELNGFS